MFTNQITLTSNPYKYKHPNDGVARMYTIGHITTGKVNPPVLDKEEENLEIGKNTEPKNNNPFSIK